ncbi:protein kinase domain-containing protein [Antribacter gilvus]|uniref:protein kinase domain-containing protein n=1 Tax=Antribacter gilvus TaxID=2304675 RepID=UPI00198031DE|nr:serine/threonine-protein kinase [Antribacter gilvus]
MGDVDMGEAKPTGGAVVGGYTIVEPLGSGAMGAVYRAEDGGGSPVALKLLHRHLDEPGARERLRREAEALQGLRHPAVARVLDAELDGPEAFIVTELVDGPTLEDEIDERGALDAHDLFELADQLADALEAVHGTGVVHRDLTPSNVLIARHGPVLIDFGLAHALGDVRATRTGFVMGTPGYLAPELLDGAEPGPDTDWWSWAAVLVFAGTGRPPFGVRPTEAVLRRSRDGRVDLIGLPSRTARALGAALRAVPTERWGPTEVARALRRSAQDLDAGIAAPVLMPGADDTEVLGAPAVDDTLVVDGRELAVTETVAATGGGSGGSAAGSAGAGSAGTAVLEAGPGAGDTAVLPGDSVLPGDTVRKGRSVTGRAVGLPVRPLGEDRYQAVGDVPPEPEDDVPAPVRGKGRGAVVARQAPAAVVVPPYQAPTYLRRRGTIAAVALPIVVLGATRPGLAFAILVVLVVTARLSGVVVDEFHARRVRRGVGRFDGTVTALKTPWHLVRAVFGSLPALLVAACAAVLTVMIGLWLFAPGRVIIVPQTSVEARSVGGMNEPIVDTWVLAAALLMAVLVAWFGPAASGTRSGARPLLALVAPGWLGSAVIVGIALVLAWLALSDWLAEPLAVTWWPLPGRPEIE